jgi:hypothetical protein
MKVGRLISLGAQILLSAWVFGESEPRAPGPQQAARARSSAPAELQLVAKATYDFGRRPAVGETRPFPEGFPGNLAIIDFDKGLRALSVKVSVPGSKGASVNRDKATCSVGVVQELPPGDRCDFWISPKKLVSVQWSYRTVDDTGQVALMIEGYEWVPGAPR